MSTQFPLVAQAGRVALITGILAGTVCQAEAEAAVLNDVQKRPRRVPVVAAGDLYASATDAARALYAKKGPYYPGQSAYDAINQYRTEVRRMCNEDCWDGFYWA